MPLTETALQTQFFDYLYGNEPGYVCICTQEPHDRSTFKQFFFQWPQQRAELGVFIETNSTRHNLWFGVNLLSRPDRKKEYCKPANLVWADLDTCRPDIIDPAPQCIIESSPRRYQAIWRLTEVIDPYIAEEFSKKVAYRYNQNGADPSGWDLTQLLRVPLTFNYKYEADDEVPQVILERAAETLLPVEIFDAMEAPQLPSDPTELDLETIPDVSTLPPTEGIVYKYTGSFVGTGFRKLFFEEPEEDWSRSLWRLLNICSEVGMSKEEMFSIAIEAKCNKFKRDNRPLKYLWRDVLKADASQQRLNALTGQFSPLRMPELVTRDELANLPPTLVDQYREWAEEATDAVAQFHDLGCFILMSCVMAGSLRLESNYGTMVPNLWGLVLGDSTLTRKTTAMRMATDFLVEIDRDIVLATDGSVEGVLSGLSQRPSQVSMFFKDEVSGFLDAIAKKEYLAGMQETLTQLYDVPEFFTRRLRKETITIVSPVFIFFGGGIRDKVYSLVNDEHILSGFIPRFLVVSGNADLSKLRRTGPATESVKDKKNALIQKFSDLYETYGAAQVTTSLGSQEFTSHATCDVFLTNEAWERYGEMEAKLVEVAEASPVASYALPTFERLSRSLLKMAMLLAASRQQPIDGTIQADVQDILQAARYVQEWGNYTIDLISNSGRGVVQRGIDKILRTIEKNPGITRSRVMQVHHLTKREMDEIQGTLDDRMQISIKKQGRGISLWPVA